MSYLPLIDLKNGFWPVVHLLYGISEWNFTDMLIIKGYILWLRIVTLTFPDCELSTFDWSENWFLACSFFYYMEYLNETSQICWPGRVAQSVKCLATDASLTADPGVASSIPARSHTFVEIDHEIISTVILLPSAESFKKGCCQLQAKVCARSTG